MCGQQQEAVLSWAERWMKGDSESASSILPSPQRSRPGPGGLPPSGGLALSSAPRRQHGIPRSAPEPGAGPWGFS